MGVLQHLQQFILSDDPHLLEVALTLYAKLTEWLSPEDVKNAAQMYEVLLRCLQHPSRKVKLAAATAAVSFINVCSHHCTGHMQYHLRACIVVGVAEMSFHHGCLVPNCVSLISTIVCWLKWGRQHVTSAPRQPDHRVYKPRSTVNSLSL